MGWYGSRCYVKPSMQEVKKLIEDDTGLTVKSLKFGYAVCVEDEAAQERARQKGREVNPDYLNFICIALWSYRQKHLMIKQIEESMGPAEVNVPLKYVNAICKATAGKDYADNWRERVRAYHRKKNEEQKMIRSLKQGDQFFVYGQLYNFLKIKSKSFVLAYNTEEKKTYRIRPEQIQFERIPLPEGVTIRNR